jgi:hypothetical protein
MEQRRQGDTHCSGPAIASGRAVTWHNQAGRARYRNPGFPTLLLARQPTNLDADCLDDRGSRQHARNRSAGREYDGSLIHRLIKGAHPALRPLTMDDMNGKPVGRPEKPAIPRS